MKKLNKHHAIVILAALAVGFSVPAQTEPQKAAAYMVSNAHLDTQWNWDIQTTIKEYVWNTLNQNLILLEKYPDYIFNFEGGVKYSWMKEYYPREYEQLKKYIADGRWHVSGASWDATDAIVPSIESAIRNILLAQTFYRDEFGIESTDIFLPDCFGFGWTLPTVAKHCGLIGFSSQKLGWRNNPFYGDRKYPFSLGIWKGVDGAKIMMAHGFNYSRRWNDEDLTRSGTVSDMIAESPLGLAYSYYGTGDIGGSPTITSVKAVVDAAAASGPVKIISAESDRLYKDFLPYEAHPELPEFDGELTMDVHGTGCYTSQAAMKLYNRQNELLGDAAERASVAAELLGVAAYPSKSLTEAWRRFIFHQFHDDLTGTSIPRAYEFSWNDELLSLKQFAKVLENSSEAVAAKLDTRVKGIPVVLYNALGHEVTDVVSIRVPAAVYPGKVSVTDAAGRRLKAQIAGYENGEALVLAEVTVPANAYAVAGVALSGKGAKPAAEKGGALENSLYKLTFDSKGDIVSLIVKADGKELVKPGKSIRLAMFGKNESHRWPAWEILKETVDREPVSFGDNAVMTFTEQGPLRTTLCIEKDYEDSKFRQYVSLYEGALAGRIDFYNEVDWASTDRLLKAEFPLTVSSPVATYDLGVGTIERGNNIPTAYEVYSQRWADLTGSDGEYGLTVVNDCKYGWDKPDDNTLRLTLIHTPETTKYYAYHNRQDFGRHTFTYSLVPHKGELDKAAASIMADGLNQRVKAFLSDRHAGELGGCFSVASIDNPRMAIKAIKKAESSDEYVVRVYELSGAGAQTGTVEFPFAISSAVKADGTEKTIADAVFSGNKLNVEVGKNGIATYKLRFSHPALARKQYAALPLAYDKKCFSWNGFGSEADFSESFSYAAELVPDTLVYCGVPFVLENEALLNGKLCKGDILALPEGKYNRLHILAASASEERPSTGVFKAAGKSATLTVPSYTGFIGQWGHSNHTEGFLKKDDVAFVGTHRHSADGDMPYEFTYMFHYIIDLPKGATEVVLPDNENLVVFAATAVDDDTPALRPASALFRTSIEDESCSADGTVSSKKNLLDDSRQIACSGYVKESERPALLSDGDRTTKWCDTSGVPAFVEYDLGEERLISEWFLVNAGIEKPAFITSTCLLKVRNSPDGEWQTVDALLSNKRNTVSRRLAEPVKARFLRLEVIQPEQTPQGRATRIYEFAVY